jgi:UDP-glucose 4-epimerase
MTAPDVSRRLRDGRAVVTGGAGFIGSHLTRRLARAGVDVTVVDDLSTGAAATIDDVRDVVEFVEGDVRDRDLVSDAVSGATVVFHLAANAHVPTSVENPSLDFEVNASGTQVVLEESMAAGVERVVLASSAAVYGPPESVPIRESHPTDPVSPYGASKLAGEKLGMAYAETYDLAVTALRIFNTYGPDQSKYVMADFFRKLEEDPEELAVLGSGEQTRSFVYVADTVDALVTLASHDDAPGEAYNLGGNETTTIRDLAALICRRYYDGEPTVRTTGEPKPGDVSRLVSDNAKIERLGVSPSVPLVEGLDELYAQRNGD